MQQHILQSGSIAFCLYDSNFMHLTFSDEWFGMVINLQYPFFYDLADVVWTHF